MAKITDPNTLTTFTADYPAELRPMLIESFRLRFGYQDRIPIRSDDDKTDPSYDAATQTIANPVTEDEFMWDRVVDWLLTIVGQAQTAKATQQAQEQAQADIQALGKEARPFIKFRLS